MTILPVVRLERTNKIMVPIGWKEVDALLASVPVTSQTWEEGIF